ncbi:MAG TPA: FAD-binding oxidoreductase [Capsulimonadaceae bacterium]|jgi:FAD/FMN-containing dehydrogenase
MVDTNKYSLSPDRRELVESWGMNRQSISYVYRPTTTEQIADVFCTARNRGFKVALRGTGCSYGDASMNAEQVVLDLTRMNRILAWDPESGVITVEPGVTIRNLWQYILEDGWWPPVVSGTSFVTLGGALGMNIHGKNNFKAGPIGDHVLWFEILLPTGELKRCSRDENSALFHAAIGGFGMLGVFTQITLQMKRVYSGLLSVDAFSAHSLSHMIDALEQRRADSDYMVGWIDCFARGEQLGRGLVHTANYLAPGEDLAPAQTLRVAHQEIPDTLFGVVPRRLMGKMLQPFSNNYGMLAINSAKFVQGDTIGNNETVLQPHAQFAFLLDYVPDWKHAYKPGGLVQFQSFVPFEHSERVFTRQIELSQKLRIVPFLGVFKRHKPDDFLMTHAVDGHSFALDYPYNDRNKVGMAFLVEQMARLVVEAGGRFYYAKDSLLPKDLARAGMGEDRIAKFAALKAECDPNHTLVTDLSRRLYDGFGV